MATKTFFWLPDAAADTTPFGSLQDGGSGPLTGDSNSQWQVGAIGKNLYAEYFRNTRRQSTDFTATVQPDGVLDNVHGDAMRTQLSYKGAFAAGTWTLTLGLRANVVDPNNPALGLRVRVFRSADPAGVGAVELTSSTIAFPNQSDLDTNRHDVSTTWTPGAITLNNEYLFFELAAQTAIFNSSDPTLTWYLETSVNDTITTPDFEPDPAPLFDQKLFLKKKKQYRKKRGPKKRSRWHPSNGVVIIQPFAFQWKKKKWPKKKPPKKKRRDRMEYVAITIATSPPGFPWKPRRKVRLSRSSYGGGRRKRLRQWQNAPLPHLQYLPALCGHAIILSSLAAKGFVKEADSGKSGLFEEMTATVMVRESRSAAGRVFETMTATATLICCK